MAVGAEAVRIMATNASDLILDIPEPRREVLERIFTQLRDVPTYIFPALRRSEEHVVVCVMFGVLQTRESLPFFDARERANTGVAD